MGFSTAAEIKRNNPSDTLRVALVGCRGMGFYDLQNALKVPGVQCIALCDIDNSVLENRKNDVQKYRAKHLCCTKITGN